MKPYSKFLSGLCIALGIVGAALLLSNNIKTLQNTQRTVNVKGLAEMDVPANRVIWPIVYKEVSDQLPVVYNLVAEKNKKIIDFLLQNGIAESEITVSAPDVIDLSADRYMNNKPQFRYNTTAVITVFSDKVDLVRKLIIDISSLGKQGIAITSTGDYRYNVQYLYTDLNKVKPKMVEEATKNARVTAVKFAEDSQSKLGKIKTASQGQISMSERDANTPHIKQLRVVSTIEYYLED